MDIDTARIRRLNQITDAKVLETYAHALKWQHFEQPMNNVVLRTEFFLPKDPIEVPFQRPSVPCFEFTYNLSGASVISIRNEPGDWHSNHIVSGSKSLGYKSKIYGIARTGSCVPIKMLHLYITPQKLAQLLGTGNDHLVGGMIDKANLCRKGRLNVKDMDPVTTSIIHQIFTRDTASPADSLFLKGKILELLAREVALWCSQQSKQSILQPEDVGKLQSARTIMMKQMVTPPSISELARKVGTNENKIKYGFKELYGVTVYGFLRAYRMQQAKLMFDRDQKSVTEVACAVGYSNVSHFGVIFRHYHGVRPGDYLRSLKKNICLHR